mmetsp:Transcript_13653/g.22534  ORF Transcript_13653/g.22534 Transcript_13653/m.22534 type:complete len:434 (-) Transcript_13653:972-2273(-)
MVPWLIVGGADKFNHDFVRGLVSSGWEVTIVCTLTADHSWRRSFTKYSSDIFILSNFLPYAHFPRFIRHLLLTRNPDVVMTSNSGLGYHLMPFLTSSCPQAVFVDYAHAEHMGVRVLPWGLGAHGQGAVSVVRHQLRGVETPARLDGDGRRCPRESSGLSQVLHVGVIVDDYGRNLIARQLLRDELKVKEQTTVVTLAARLDENKQPGILCHVATDIVKTQKFQGDVHFLVAGSGDQRLALKKCIRSKKLKKKFTMLGYVSLEGMKEVLSASDVLFLPSQMEGIPCVFYEAMAAGIPVIGPGDGGIAELVHNDVTGYVVDVKNGTEFKYKLVSVPEQIKRYSSALMKLLSNPALARQMGSAGKNVIRTDFNIDRIVEKFIASVNEKRALKEGGGVCRADPKRTDKLNEDASIAPVQGVLHSNVTPAYCTLTKV